LCALALSGAFSVFAAEGYNGHAHAADGKVAYPRPEPSQPPVVTSGKKLATWRKRPRTPSSFSTARISRIGAPAKAANRQWKIENGYMETTKDVIWTKDEFGDFQLHLRIRHARSGQGQRQGPRATTA